MIALRQRSVALALLFCTFLSPGAHSPSSAQKTEQGKLKCQPDDGTLQQTGKTKECQESWGVAQLLECLLCTHPKPFIPPPASHKSRVWSYTFVHIRNSSMQEVEAGGSEARGHPQLQGSSRCETQSERKKRIKPSAEGWKLSGGHWGTTVL